VRVQEIDIYVEEELFCYSWHSNRRPSFLMPEAG
jgi:hypothetical protein